MTMGIQLESKFLAEPANPFVETQVPGINRILICSMDSATLLSMLVIFQERILKKGGRKSM